MTETNENIYHRNNQTRKEIYTLHTLLDWAELGTRLGIARSSVVGLGSVSSLVCLLPFLLPRIKFEFVLRGFGGVWGVGGAVSRVESNGK